MNRQVRLVQGRIAEPFHPSLDLLGDQVRDLLTTAVVDEDASAHLFELLGDIPLRVSDAVAAQLLSADRADEAVRLATALQDLLRDHARESLSGVFGRVQDVLDRAGEGCGPGDLLAKAPAALCEACGFDRAVLSRVEGSTMVPRLLHSTGAQVEDVVEVLSGLRLPLKSGLVETEVARRRAPALVQDAQNDPRTYLPLVEQAGVTSYVVAAVVVSDRTVGLLHADTESSGRRLTTRDRDMAQLFADCFGRAYERAVTSERVLAQRERLRVACAMTDGQVPEIDPTVIRFAKSAPGISATVPVVVPLQQIPSTGMGLGALTSRESQILRLLAEGATNQQIAESLVLGESTVKSHVKRILRKLPAANRAEAAYVFHRLASTA